MMIRRHIQTPLTSEEYEWLHVLSRLADQTPAYSEALDRLHLRIEDLRSLYEYTICDHCEQMVPYEGSCAAGKDSRTCVEAHIAGLAEQRRKVHEMEDGNWKEQG